MCVLYLQGRVNEHRRETSVKIMIRTTSLFDRTQVKLPYGHPELISQIVRQVKALAVLCLF